MDVYYIDQVNMPCDLPRGRAVSIGLFDGVHQGHRSLFDATKNMAGSFSVLTFSNLKKSGGALTSESERFDMFGSLGARDCFVIDFNLIKDMTPHEFVKRILIELLGISACGVGYNFAFGRGRSGNAEYLVDLLKPLGIKTVIAPAKVLGGEAVSSSRIKKCLLNGNVAEANKLLGYEYSFSGEIINGAHIGRTLGIPTINLEYEREKTVPKLGVYASRVVLDGREFCGITNIGMRPTLGGGDVSVETNILSAEGNFYGKCAKVAVLEFLRTEMKFASLDELKNQIEEDIEKTKEYFNKIRI